MKKYTFFYISFFISFAFLQSCSIENNNTSIRVVSIEKVVNTNVPGYEICSSLSLVENDIVKYFALAEEVEGGGFHSEAIILPCKYKGTIYINDNLFQWEVNAGGAGYLYNKEINKRYLCKVNCCKSLPMLC